MIQVWRDADHVLRERRARWKRAPRVAISQRGARFQRARDLVEGRRKSWRGNCREHRDANNPRLQECGLKGYRAKTVAHGVVVVRWRSARGPHGFGDSARRALMVERRQFDVRRGAGGDIRRQRATRFRLPNGAGMRSFAGGRLRTPPKGLVERPSREADYGDLSSRRGQRDPCSRTDGMRVAGLKRCRRGDKKRQIANSD